METASPLHVQMTSSSREKHAQEPVPAASEEKGGDGFEYMEQWRVQFEERKALYRQEIYDHHTPNKHTFISWALKTGVPDKAFIDDILIDVRKRHKDIDMHIISLVRVLYVMKAHAAANPGPTPMQAICEDIANALSSFPYWPSKDWQTAENEHLCFWSENHILMCLGSAHLVRQYNRQSRSAPSSAAGGGEKASTSASLEPEDASAVLEDQLLLAYLQAHASNAIMFEVLSHVYIPYTVSALLNLVDFSENALVREAARAWLSLAVRHVLLGTTDAGVVTLTASARAFERTRFGTTGHNINQLVHLLTGATCDGGAAHVSQIVDFLLTTTWLPSATDLACHTSQGSVTLRGSPPVENVRNLFPSVAESERVPFYWSAGLLLHPDFTRDTKEYQRRKKLNNNDTLWAFSWFPDFAAAGLVRAYGPISRGQSYCGITVNFYKRCGGLLLSSFDRYNVGNSAFQQLPWCANIGGAGVWTQTGGAEGKLAKAFTNTYNPLIRQRGSLCMINHCVPGGMAYGPVTGLLLTYVARLYWPALLFDADSSFLYTRRYNGTSASYTKYSQSWLRFSRAVQDSPVPCWRLARRGLCFIGVYCTHGTAADPLPAGTAEASATYRTIACAAKQHTWIVVVGTEDQYYDEEEEEAGAKTKDQPGAGAKSGGDGSKASTQPSADAAPDRSTRSFLNFIQRCLRLSVVDPGVEGDLLVEDEREGKLSLKGMGDA